MSELDVPPEKYEEHVQQFFAQVGFCITIWSDIERLLFHIFELATRTEEHIASALFYRALALEARLQLVDTVMSARYEITEADGTDRSAPIFHEYKAAAKFIRTLLPMRNLIAHQPVSTVHDGGAVRSILGMRSLPAGKPLHLEIRLDEIATVSGKTFRVTRAALQDLVEHHAQVRTAFHMLTPVYSGALRPSPFRPDPGS